MSSKESLVNGNVYEGIAFRSESAAKLYARTQEERPPIDVTINIQTKSAAKNQVHLKAIDCLMTDTPFILYDNNLNYTMVNPSFMAIRQVKNGQLYNDQLTTEAKSFTNSVKMLILGYDKIAVGQQALDFQKNILQTIEKIL